MGIVQSDRWFSGRKGGPTKWVDERKMKITPMWSGCPSEPEIFQVMCHLRHSHTPCLLNDTYVNIKNKCFFKNGQMWQHQETTGCLSHNSWIKMALIPWTEFPTLCDTKWIFLWALSTLTVWQRVETWDMHTVCVFHYHLNTCWQLVCKNHISGVWPPAHLRSSKSFAGDLSG